MLSCIPANKHHQCHLSGGKNIVYDSAAAPTRFIATHNTGTVSRRNILEQLAPHQSLLQLLQHTGQAVYFRRSRICVMLLRLCIYRSRTLYTFPVTLRSSAGAVLCDIKITIPLSSFLLLSDKENKSDLNIFIHLNEIRLQNLQTFLD